MRLLALLFIISLVACTTKQKSHTSEPRIVQCITATHLTKVSRDFAALTTADDASNLAFKIAGRVVDVPVAKGNYVKRGQLLAELDDSDIRLQVQSAYAAYNEARSRLERARRLLEHNAVSQQEVESAESAATQAYAAYENSLALLADTRITAPFDGVIERTYVDAFQRVASGEPIVRIVNPVSTTVGFTAPENIVTQLAKPTTHFSVEFDAYPDVNFDAVIKSFARTSSDALGFPVSLRLINVDTSRYEISPGMTCIATVTIPESDSLAVVVPLTAIYAPASGGEYVWIVDTDNRVRLTLVDLGTLTGSDEVVVLSGIRSGDKVVTAGVYRLKEGEKVRIMNNGNR